jgi:peptidoglycan/LPS O-acetylase OafA/YrhL
MRHFIEILISNENRTINRYLLVKLVFQLFSKVGMFSYSIYLLHQPYLSELISLFNPNMHNVIINYMISLPLAVGSIFCLSLIYYHVVEQKSIQIGKYVSRK